MEKIIEVKGRYLSDVMTELPDHCLFDKGITGCGGTTLELEAKRNSIIAVPTRNLALSKAKPGRFVFIGKVPKANLEAYLKSDIQYKKILITYDMVSKLPEYIDPQEWMLLIDEYHLLFNDYSFRSDAVQGVLKTYNKFAHWCFMTATPLDDNVILHELEDVDKVILKWTEATRVNIHIEDTCQVLKKLSWMMQYDQRNLHIFLNSVKTIKQMTEGLGESQFRVLCSSKNASKIKGFALPTDPVKKYNFYTSCSFEGVDVYDPNGLCIIVSDSNIATTLLDISTKVRQICGRLRDSKYKDEVYFILNTRKHRYAGTSECTFQNLVEESERLGHTRQNLYDTVFDDQQMAIESKLYSETFTSIYLNKYNDKVYYDQNLKTIDLYNYKLVSEIYASSINVLTECNKTMTADSKQVIVDNKGLKWINDYLRAQTKDVYTFEELEEIFKPMFKERDMRFNARNSIKLFFPTHHKSRRLKDGIMQTFYKFDL